MPLVIVCPPGPVGGRRRCSLSGPARSQRPFAWVSVDEKDNDPIVLLTYVAAALDRVSPLDPSVFEALASPGASVEGTWSRVWGRPWRRWTSRSSWSSMTCICSRAGVPGCHRRAREACSRGLAAGALDARRPRVAAREPCGRGAWRWRSAPDELRLDEAEARQLLSAAGLDLTAAEVAELTGTRRAGPRVCTWRRSRPRRAAPG